MALDSPFRRLEVLDTEEWLWTLHFKGPEAKVWKLKSRVSFEADWVFRRSRTPLEADYGISKVQNLEADWYFEGLEFRGGLVWNLEADWYFKGLKFKADRRWTLPRSRSDLRLSRGLLAEFEVIGFPDAYWMNFED
ncbi:hypothetical protein RclHR1_23690002 [Rhizophagus clarus]|uniref:Uncharacterized protein n=1 Tax=Rhizophagus clarus TaxID=94130 RepID=A0A2Z6QWV9_9GLOM|nr:hypothetical protein RclHR1_23690002 [Rhizophagus clarus]